MAYLTVNERGGVEILHLTKPKLIYDEFWEEYRLVSKNMLYLPDGSIKELIGKELTYEKSPYKI